MTHSTKQSIAYLNSTHRGRAQLGVEFNRRLDPPSATLDAANAKIREASKPSSRERREDNPGN